MENLLFPTWQVDWYEYTAVCAYLGLTPKKPLYEKLTEYLLRAPFRFERPRGFSGFLAKPGLSRFRVARLDLTTKLLFPNHPVRHLLNAVVAIHECDAEGYGELASAPEGGAVVPMLLGWGVQFGFSASITLVWLLGQFILYAVGMGWRSAATPTGKRILITGVNRGLGHELLLYALEQGAEVVGTVRDSDSLERLNALLPQEAPVRLVAADLSVSGALVQALQQEGIEADSVDMAMVCAGVKNSQDSVLSLPGVRATFEVNLFAAIETAAWFCQPQREQTLVLISSIGRWHGMHSTCGYNASKAALSIWAESLELELHLAADQDTRVLVVEPGLFESGMVQRKGLYRWLVMPRRKLVERILNAALSGKRVLRDPFWFAVLTWVVLAGGRRFRAFLFARTKK